MTFVIYRSVHIGRNSMGGRNAASLVVEALRLGGESVLEVNPEVLVA